MTDPSLSPYLPSTRPSSPPPNAPSTVMTDPLRDRGDEKDIPRKEEIFFHPPLPDLFRCPICLCVLRDPVQTACGHVFCATCLTRTVSRNVVNCPVDKRRCNLQTELYPDNFLQRQVRDLKVVCKRQRLGCDWSGRLVDYFRLHRFHSCPYDRVRCRLGCPMPIFRRWLVAHETEDCDERLVSCSACGDTRIRSKALVIHSLLDCPGKMVDCRFCGKRMPRRELVEHTKKRPANNVLAAESENACAATGLMIPDDESRVPKRG